MKSSILTALLAVPLATLAADPADPAAPAPRLEYRSALEGIPRGVEQATEDWKRANSAVAQFPRGHVDLLKWEESQPASAPAPASRPAPPAAQPQAPRGPQH